MAEPHRRGIAQLHRLAALRRCGGGLGDGSSVARDLPVVAVVADDLGDAARAASPARPRGTSPTGWRLACRKTPSRPLATLARSIEAEPSIRTVAAADTAARQAAT